MIFHSILGKISPSKLKIYLLTYCSQRLNLPYLDKFWLGENLVELAIFASNRQIKSTPNLIFSLLRQIKSTSNLIFSLLRQIKSTPNLLFYGFAKLNLSMPNFLNVCLFFKGIFLNQKHK